MIAAEERPFYFRRKFKEVCLEITRVQDQPLRGHRKSLI